ncbi:dihydrofolate reductase [Halobacteriovorax sp. GB3]|uniref:dihydrofolate reductase n=1 Tax=Halobacteriovorax sp. GB3 TaxID=2719615 RepID=UPI002360DDEB|nr:dihydrofolate reductase [Halobacteriovorax sp. GB3]MDD0852914.1 dihydrofolate reductase [Halobacteriovorax sp. GB3]
MIVAKAQNNCIGKDNQLPWRLSGDLKNFKRITMGHHMLMGRKTFESIGKALPGRTSLVLSKTATFSDENLFTFDHIEKAIDFARERGESEFFIIGGAGVYASFFDLVDRLYLTDVHADVEGDAFFPKVDLSSWRLVQESFQVQDEKNSHPWTFKILEK